VRGRPSSFPKAMHGVVPPPSRRTKGSARLIPFVFVLTTAGYCYTCPPPPAPAPPSLAAIRVLPGEVWAAPGAQFRLRAEVTNDAGYVLPPEDLSSVTWESSSLPGFTAVSGPKADITAPTSGTYPQNYPIIVKYGTLPQATVTIHVVDGQSTSGVDWVSAKQRMGDPPAIVLVDGQTSGPIEDQVIAIAGKAALDYFVCPTSAPKCGEVTLFSESQRLYREDTIKFTSGCNAVQFSGDAGFPGTCAKLTRTVSDVQAVRANIYVLASDVSIAPSSAVWTSTSSPLDVMEVVKRDRDYAKARFSDAWTGMTIDPAITRIIDAEIDITLGPDYSCDGVDQTVAQQLSSAGVVMTTPMNDAITVAYVGRIIVNGHEATGLNAATCPWNKTDGSIVVISWSQWNGTALAHEFLHALGPWSESPWGHTNGVPGFTSQNLLWESEDPASPFARSLLTLGQAFRLTLDAYSLSNRGNAVIPAPGSYLCQGIFSVDEKPCPRLTKDVRNP